MHRTFLRCALAFAPLLLAGCADIDPYRAAYRWQPEGANQANLAAQVVEPLDLVHGRSDAAGDGGRAAAAIAKWEKAGPGGGKSLSSEAGTIAPAGGS